MKVAFMIAAHSNFIHLKRLIEELLSYKNIDSHIFIHIDKKTKTKFEYDHNKVTVLKNRIKVYWGGFSQVQATLNMIETAFNKDKFDYYCLMSGQDFPIRPEDFILNKFNKRKEYINCVKMPIDSKPLKRLTNYWPEYKRIGFSFQKLFMKPIELFERYILRLRKKINFTPYCGSNWFYFTGDFIKYIKDYINANPDFIPFHKYSLCPDESFFQTILGNSPFIKNQSTTLMYADWNVPTPPAVINKDHVDFLKENITLKNEVYGDQEPTIARKFTDDSLPVIKYIKEILY